ncbi:MAG: hypothetical protein K8R77_09400 [Anaerolineaceae bacterium]|nr:hypothetical protein [Anaerolineaceae bacterium]
MNPLNKDRLEAMIVALDERDKDRAWLRVLEVFLPVGVADMVQLQRITGFDRDKIRRIMGRYRKCAAGAPSVIEKLSFQTSRAGVRGRSPQIYRLGETGAALLRTVLKCSCRPCGLYQELVINHAVIMLDVRLEAQQRGLEVITDKEIKNHHDNIMRPDHLVTVAPGRQLIYEIEQAASPQTLRRIIKSIEHKRDYFAYTEGDNVSPEIRMIVNAAPGREYQKTLRIWGQAGAIATRGSEPGFHIFAMPLVNFLTTPDFADSITSGIWNEVVFQQGEEKEQENTASKAVNKKMPVGLVRRSAREDRLVMEAIWQNFCETAALTKHDHPFPEPEFFEILQLIYLASHDTGILLNDAAMPWASIYLLNRYLQMNPALRKTLLQALKRGGPSMRWNPTNILHRMQVVINCFLGYHGWRSNGVLKAYPGVPTWDVKDVKTFGVGVKIIQPLILMLDRDGVVPSQEEVLHAEKALEWVLLALFAYGDHLGLGQVSFW